jgi:hypothetical protein
MLDRELVNKIITLSAKILFSALFVLITISIFAIEITKKPQDEIDAVLDKQRENVIAMLAGRSNPENTQGVDIAQYWPPKMNQPYPDIALVDRGGRAFKLSDMKGYVIVMSYIDMSSPISQAQAGAGTVGAYGLTKDIDKYTEPFLKVVEKNAPDNFKLPNDGVLEINVLVYTQDGSQPTLDDADKWAEHFDLNLERGIIVAVPKEDMRSSDTQSIITGYQLVDQHMMLRVDSAGIEAKHNLKMTLVPMLSKLAQ